VDDLRASKLELGAWLDAKSPFGIYRGTKKILEIYKGSTAIGRVQLGAALLYQKPPASVTSTQWRLNIFENNGGSIHAIDKIEMRAVAGGPNLATGGTASASNQTNGAAVNAFDDATNRWGSNNASQHWIAYTLPAGIMVNEITIKAPVAPTEAPVHFTLDYWDGSNWVTKRTLFHTAGWTAGQVITFDTSDPPAINTSLPLRDKWRIQLVSSDSGYLGFAEVYFFEQIGGADRAFGGTATASSVYIGGLEAPKAVDRSGGTIFHSGQSNNSDWWQLDLAAPIRISRMAIRSRGSENGVAPRHFHLQYWNGSSWVTQKTISGLAAWSSYELRQFDVT
jgi:hypothetical protein